MIMVERKQRNESQMKKLIKVPVMTTNTGRKRERMKRWSRGTENK